MSTTNELTAGEKAFAWINAQLDAGRSVTFTTYTKATRYSAKHRAMIKVANGELFIQNGKSWLCVATKSQVLVGITA